MRTSEMRQPIGSLRISKDVIATISKFATKEIDGVSSLAPFTANITGWAVKKRSARSIVINLNDDVAVIDVHVIVRFGSKITDVSTKIQQNVKDAVQNMTGITVAKVNVNISGVDFAKSPEEEMPIEEEQED